MEIIVLVHHGIVLRMRVDATGVLHQIGTIRRDITKMQILRDLLARQIQIFRETSRKKEKDNV